MRFMPEDMSKPDAAWKQFGPVLAAKREATGLNRSQAAVRAGMAPTTWSQVEKGYVMKRGGRQDDYPPTRDFVVKAVKALRSAGSDWDLADALTAAGLKPERLPADDVEIGPTKLGKLWNRMTRNQQRAWLWAGEVMVDPHAGLVDEPVPASDKATPLFVPADTERAHRS